MNSFDVLNMSSQPPGTYMPSPEAAERRSQIPHVLPKAAAALPSAISPNRIQVRKQEISQRSGTLWRCLSRKISPFGGFLYKFRLKSKYDDVTVHEGSAANELEIKQHRAERKLQKVFPAAEFHGSQSLALDPSVPEDELPSELLPVRKHLDVLLQLGYKTERRADGVYLYLPDREALIASWEKLRESRPELPPLKILSSEKVADDIDFVETYFTHDGLLSLGEEFPHDHQIHLLSVICLILSSEVDGNPSYQAEKSRLAQLIDKTYRRVMIGRSLREKNVLNIPEEELELLNKYLPQMEATLGSLTDTIWGADNYITTQDINTKLIYDNHGLFLVWKENGFWFNYFSRRFGPCKREEVIAMGKQLEDYERRFDALPNSSSEFKFSGFKNNLSL